ncbi:autotransporter outer membrane beta-barrel domain-containing protein [Erwiniaceae bacterium BAC15a-03b]|uniref:Autotransporter outer membrane beta-barrel domain-containing protein n=1 Tax=Winslowiella arboricola TaxID=2978220 RepID=A0A9J6PMH6_9GAMM|nr:autotransporter outer membrane beta-barrel domain-containing protein [Winslowiella arboricola]MCU5771485.1 autotransporter outer membrane beta-barrel domain-containing protein [Winslowiella arboricola]MCU5778602.1 autotransporter outer membrane beta-barrel domain-containing protein [Winslowiella arboricola]
MMLKVNSLLCALIILHTSSFITGNVRAVVLQSFNPVANDNLTGSVIVSGTSQSLTGNQQFTAGASASQDTTLSNVNITSGAQFLNQPRLEPGPQNFAITVPDAATGGNTVFQVYNPANLVALPPATGSTVVPDIINVADNQYINTQIASVSNGGTLLVNIGSGTASSTASTHAWSMAAKQSSLFNVDGSSGTLSTLNWGNNNRITFFGKAATPVSGSRAQLSYTVADVATFKGAFSVQTLDGSSTAFNVTSAAGLKTYNDWLIEQLQAGRLDKARYLTEFNRAFSKANGNIFYDVTATAPDEATLPIGNRVLINATGANARVNVAASRTLEVSGATAGAIRATGGAQVRIDGKLSSQGDDTEGITDSSAIWLNGSSALNSATGVINGGFLNRADTSNSGIGLTSYNANGVRLADGSVFTNNGVLNFATTGSNTPFGVAAINIGASSNASNSGNINIGINGSSATGTTSGVLLNSNTSAFTNFAGGTLYIGRGPQNTLSETVADTAMNQSGLTSGIAVIQQGNAINNGNIVIGSRAQNSAGMFVSGATGAVVRNHQIIDVNGRASSTPRENYGMLVVNSGSGDAISNDGTISLNGINGIGIKVLATGSNSAGATSTGIINVAGAADPASGTRNFGVWVEGQGNGNAAATIDGPVNLTGNGAIGVHARGRAVVTVESAAAPSFSQGSNQIAFFAYGPSADINVAGNTLLNVATSGSTLFRVEDGADFDGTDLLLTTSGANAVAVRGSGTATNVDTHNADMTISGNGAVGAIIEGGATGVIDTATTLTLSGINAIGAIVDGQKQSLSGTNSGTPVASTSLVSAAALVAAQNGLTGYIARQLGQLTNSGEITFSGANTTGILAQSGATATNTGNITVSNGGSGILVNNASQTTTANNRGVINANGGSVTARTRAVSASGPLAVVNLSAGALNLNGVGALGAQAMNGAKINLAADAAPVFHNSDQIAFHASGAGSTINSASADLAVSSDRSTGYRIDNGAVVNFSGANSITSSGAESTGVIVSGSGSNLTSGNSDLLVTGSGSIGIRVEGGGTATLSADSGVTINGTDGVGVLVNNLRTDLANALNGENAATTVTSSANVGGNGASATGFEVVNGASLIQQGMLKLDGDNSTGIRSRSAASIINHGVVNIANGRGIDISGSGATQVQGGSLLVNDGIAGVVVGSEGFPALSDTTITSAGSAHGILLDTGAGGLTVSNTSINVQGDGNGLENRAETGAVTLGNVAINVAGGNGIRTAVSLDPSSTVTTTVNGSGTGLNFIQLNDAAATADLMLGDGWQFTVQGAGASGIRASTTGTVYNAAKVSVVNPSGGAALAISSAKSVINSGVLSSQSTVSPVVDFRGGSAAIFENHATIAARAANRLAVAGSDEDDTVRLLAGDIRGDIDTGDGNDIVQWVGGSLDGSLTLAAGDTNQALVQGIDLSTTGHITSGEGSGNTLNLADIVARGGSFTADDAAKGVNLGSGWSTVAFQQSLWTLTDKLQLAGSEVYIDSASTLYAGDGVHPVIAGGADNALTLINDGIIDLTNGSGSPGNSLSINGDLVSGGGQLNLVTRLNAGGALNNQFTDNLRVTGNASSGSTLINVALDALSSDALTDLNHNSNIESYEGISLAQVAGNADAASFVLAGGSLAAGPWRYQLYSFAPGASDADQRRVAGGGNNQFWDYRLANVYLCENDNSCPPPAQPGQPTPTNPQAPPVAEQPSPPGSPRLDNPPPDGCVVDGIDSCAPGRQAVIAQVPAYISAPIGLTYYTAAIIDDLHKRLGELRQQQTRTDGNGAEMFARYIGADLDYKSNVGFRNFGYDLDIDYSALQIGGNLLRLEGEEDTLRGGIAYIRGNTRLRPKAADGDSSTRFDSNSVALYGTWQRQNGLYVDGVLSFDWHRGETDTGSNKNVGRPKGRGWSASVESGYPVTLPYDIKLEPQAQLIYMRLNMDDFTDKQGTTVKYDHDAQTVGRLGARLDRSWSDNGNRQYTPYLRANYYRGWGGATKTTVGATGTNAFDHTFTGGRFGQMVEVGVGGTTTFNNDLSLYAEADYRKAIDNNGARGWRYNIGVRWQF